MVIVLMSNASLRRSYSRYLGSEAGLTFVGSGSWSEVMITSHLGFEYSSASKNGQIGKNNGVVHVRRPAAERVTRLRVGDYRVFYDVDDVAAVVTVLRVMSKEESLVYLAGLEQKR
jgi:hypothetical protein